MAPHMVKMIVYSKVRAWVPPPTPFGGAISASGYATHRSHQVLWSAAATLPLFEGASMACALQERCGTLTHPQTELGVASSRIYSPSVCRRALSTSLIGKVPMTRSIATSAIVARLSVATTESVSKPLC